MKTYIELLPWLLGFANRKPTQAGGFQGRLQVDWRRIGWFLLCALLALLVLWMLFQLL